MTFGLVRICSMIQQLTMRITLRCNRGVVTMICCTCSVQFLSFTILLLPSGVNTIIEPLPQPFVQRQNSTFCVSDFKFDVHAARSVGEKNITLDAVMFHPTHSPNSYCNGLSLSELIHWTRDTTLPESAIGRSSRHPTAKRSSFVSRVPAGSSLSCVPEKTLADDLGNSVEFVMTLLHF